MWITFLGQTKCWIDLRTFFFFCQSDSLCCSNMVSWLEDVCTCVHNFKKKKKSGLRNSMTELLTLLRSVWEKKNNIPHEVPFYWKMQHFKLLGGSERPPCVSGWRHPELCWNGLVYLLEAVGCDWSVWILYKTSSGAEKRRPVVVFKSGLFTDNLLEVMIIKKEKKSFSKCSQIVKEVSKCFKSTSRLWGRFG